MAIGTATALAIGGLAISGATAGASFAAADTAAGHASDARNAANLTAAKNEQLLKQNMYKSESLNLQPYQDAREAQINNANSIVQAGAEGDVRGVGAVAGRALMGGIDQQQQIVLSEIAAKQAQQRQISMEDSRLRDIQFGANQQNIAGAMQAERDQSKIAAQQQMAGFSALGGMAQQALSLVPLYQKSASGDAINAIAQGKQGGWTNQQMSNSLNKAGINTSASTLQADISNLNQGQRQAVQQMFNEPPINQSGLNAVNSSGLNQLPNYTNQNGFDSMNWAVYGTRGQ